jgi:hypothetical protein
MENKITLFGASGHCKVIMDILQNSNTAVGVVIDDNPDVKAILGKAVTPSDQIDSSALNNVIVTIGNNKIRKTVVSRCWNRSNGRCNYKPGCGDWQALYFKHGCYN